MAIMVPEYGNQKVQRSALPEARVQPAAGFEEAAGGGASAAAVVTAGRELNTATQRLIGQQQQNADEVAIQEADLKAGLMQNKLHVEMQKLQGKDALGATDYLNKEWTKGADELMKGLSNDNQKAAMQKRLNARYLNLDGVAQVHTANEMQKYDTETTNSYIKNAQDDAALNYGDPDRVKLALMQQETSFAQYANRNGLSDAATKAGYTDLKNKTHVAVLNRMLADNQLDLAKGYFQANKASMVGPDADRISNFIDKETMLDQANTKANEILATGKDDPAHALKELDKIPDKALRAATKAEYENKLKQMTVALNQGEATVTTRMAQGLYKNPYALEADRASVSPEFYKVATESFGVKYSSVGSKSERATKYSNLVEKFGGLSDADIFAQSKKYADFRKDVLANKGSLSEQQFNKLLSWTDPNFVEQAVEPKKSWLQSGIKFITNYYRGGADAGLMAQALGSFMTKATDQSVKPEDVSAVARGIVRDEAYRRNPDMMNLAEPTNYVHSEGNISVAYPARSDAKNDTTVNEDTVNVIRRSDGQKGTIPRKNFDNSRYKLA